MNGFVDILTIFSQYSSLILPIITLLILIIPKLRVILKKGLRNIIGIGEINDKLDKVNEQSDNFKQEISKTIENLETQFDSLHRKFDQHTELDEKKLLNQVATAKNSLMSAFYFYIDRKYITIEELNVLEELYSSYSEIGGNGVIKKMWENDISKLPNRKPIKRKGSEKWEKE